MRSFACTLCVLVAAAGPDARKPGDDEPERRQAGIRAPTPDELDRRELELRRAQALARAQVTLDGGSFRSLGPTDGPPGWLDAGRVRAIVADPRDPATLYLGTAGGGVFKTTNADADSPVEWRWTPLTDDLPASSAQGNVAVGDLAMSPADSRTLWLGLGDPLGIPSRGFFVTHDGGATWERGGELPSLSIHRILPLDGQTLLVATDVGLWRSTDGGRSFARTVVDPARGPVDAMPVTALAQLPSGRVLMGRADIGRSPPAILWTSDDAGLTWTLAAANHHARYPSRVTLATSRASSTIAWAIVNDNSLLLPALLETTDGGSTWTEVPAPTLDTAQGWYNQLLLADDDDPQRLFVGTRTLYATTDGGATFRVVSSLHADQQAAAWWSSGGRKRLLIGNDGGLAVLKDPAAAALLGDNSHNKGVSSHLVYHLGCTRDRTGIGTQDDGTRLARDGSGYFAMVAGGDGFFTLLHPQRSLLLFQVNDWTYREDLDAGTSQLSSVADAFWGNPLVADEGDPAGDTVYRLGGHTVYRSTDFGASFTALPGQGLPSGLFRLAVSATAPKALAVAAIVDNQVRIYVSTDGGASWTLASTLAGVLPDGLSFDSHDARTLYLASEVSPMVLRSRDQGRTWESLEHNGYPTVWTHFVRNDPQDSNVLFAGNDFGLYWSRDAGLSWSRYGQGLPWVSARDLCLLPGRAGLRVGTYGRGVWEAPMPLSSTLSVQLPSPAAVLSRGASEAFTVAVNDAAVLSVSGLPAGVTGTFDRATLPAAGTSTLTLTASASAQASSDVVFTVTAVQGAERASAQGRLSVVVPVADFEVSVDSARVELQPNAALPIAVRTRTLSGNAQTLTFSVEGLPGGVRGAFDRIAITAGESAVLTLTAGDIASEGDASLVATGQAATHRVPLHVRVAQVTQAPAPGAPSTPPAAAHGGCDAAASLGPLALLGLFAWPPRRRRGG